MPDKQIVNAIASRLNKKSYELAEIVLEHSEQIAQDFLEMCNADTKIEEPKAQVKLVVNCPLTIVMDISEKAPYQITPSVEWVTKKSRKDIGDTCKFNPNADMLPGFGLKKGESVEIAVDGKTFTIEGK